MFLAVAAGLVTAWGTGGNLQPEADGNGPDGHLRQQDTKRYLSFAVCGGITNQRLGLLDALLVAHATDLRCVAT